jgi:hypothetical protein
MVLRRIFGPKRDEVKEDLRKLHNVLLNDMYSSPKNFHAIKLRRIRLLEHVAHMGRGKFCRGFCWENLKNRDHLKDPGVDGRIILKWIFRKWDGGGGVWNGSRWLRIRRGGWHV